MRSDAESFDIIDRALDAANADEADAVFISSDSNISRFANSNIHQNMSEVSAELTLRLVINGAMGVASTTSFELEDIEEMADVAREAARHSLPLPNFKGLYRSAGSQPAPSRLESRLYTPSPADKARALRQVFDCDAQFAGSYSTSASSIACGNTHDVRRYATMTVAEATVIAIRGDDSGYATAIARDRVAPAPCAPGDRAVSARWRTGPPRHRDTARPPTTGSSPRRPATALPAAPVRCP